MIKNLKIIQITELNEQAKKQIFDLWNNEYPEKLSYNIMSELESYLGNLNNVNHFLLTKDVDLILGWALIFDRDRQRKSPSYSR